jgi:hypothetical protein
MAASGFLDTFAQQLLGLAFANQTLTNAIPSTWYLALSTSAPTAAAGGIVEPVGNGYARQAIAQSAWNNPSGSGTVSIANTNAIQYPVSSGSWGTILGWVLYDALTSGNPWFFGQLASGVSVPSGRVFQFAAGEVINQLVSASGPFTGFTDFGASALLKGVLKGTAFGFPTFWYLGVSTSAPTAAGGFTEPTAASYARLQITRSSTQFPTAGSGATTVTIANLLARQMATVGSPGWGTLIGWGLYDASTTGNLWLSGSMTSLTPAVGEAVYVPSGGLIATLQSST